MVVVVRLGGGGEGADGGVFSEFGVWVGVFSRGFFLWFTGIQSFGPLGPLGQFFMRWPAVLQE